MNSWSSCIIELILLVKFDKLIVRIVKFELTVLTNFVIHDGRSLVTKQAYNCMIQYKIVKL